MVWRKLQHNKSCQIARRLVFVDCETKDQQPENPLAEVHRLWFGLARTGRVDKSGGSIQYTCQQEQVFWSIPNFWDWIKTVSEVRKTTWIYAHNAGFDLTILGLWEKIRDGDLKITKPRRSRDPKTKKEIWHGLLILEDPPTVLGLEDRDGRRYVVCDTLNYWRTSLAVLGKSVGLEKIDMPDWEAPIEDWIAYCRRDVEVIELAVLELLRWWKENDLGNWRWTGPGLSMSAFRHKFLKHDIVFHDRYDVRALERKAYYGGQLEAYQLGDIPGPVFQYDVSSLYPSVMRGNLFPTVLRHWSLDSVWTRGAPPYDPATMVAEVQLKPCDQTFPKRNKDGVSYCQGPGQTFLCGPELAFAHEHNLIERWGRWSTYEMGEIFTDYVDYFYGLKLDYELQNRPVQRTFVKLLLNSLYGKFGQRGGKWVFNEHRIPLLDFGIFHEINFITKAVQKCLAIWDVVLDWTPLNEVEQAFPAIAAWVTAYSRQEMRSLREIAGQTHYFYQSTDSLLVDSHGSDALIAAGKVDGDRLGSLKLEQTADSAWIGGLHWYRIGDKLIEGSKKSSAVTIDSTSWSELQFDSLRSVLANKGRPEITIKRVTKTRTAQYTKGVVSQSGQVTPHQLVGIS